MILTVQCSIHFPFHFGGGGRSSRIVPYREEDDDDVHSFAAASDDESVTLADEDLFVFKKFISRYLKNPLLDLSLSFITFAFTPYEHGGDSDTNCINEYIEECFLKFVNSCESIQIIISALFGKNEDKIWTFISGPYIGEDSHSDSGSACASSSNKKPLITQSLKNNLIQIGFHSILIMNMATDFFNLKKSIYDNEEIILKEKTKKKGKNGKEEIEEIEEIILASKSVLEDGSLEIINNISLLIRATGIFPSYHSATTTLVLLDGFNLLQERIDKHNEILSSSPSSFHHSHSLAADNSRRDRLGHKLQKLLSQSHQMIILCICAHKPLVKETEDGDEMEDAIEEVVWVERIPMLIKISSYLPIISKIIRDYGDVYTKQKEEIEQHPMEAKSLLMKLMKKYIF